MEVNLEEVTEQQVIEVDGLERWTIYQRLRELEIPCSCGINQPLKVQINHSMALVQLWSVMRHCSSSRQEMILLLQRCWQCDS